MHEFEWHLVDDSDSKMTFEELNDDERLSEEINPNQENVDQNGRSRIHVGSSEFQHLENYDMNKLCARVVLYGQK